MYIPNNKLLWTVVISSMMGLSSGVALADGSFDLRSVGDGTDCQIVYPANEKNPVLQWSRKTGVNKVIGISPTKNCPKTFVVDGQELAVTKFTSYRIDGNIFSAIRPDIKFVFYKLYGNNYRFRAIDLVPKT